MTSPSRFDRFLAARGADLADIVRTPCGISPAQTRRMRWLVTLTLALAGCSSLTSDPGPGSGSDKEAVCEDARDCTPSDTGCASYPYESLPPHCVEICYLGRCCEQYDGAWHQVIYD